MKNREDCCDLLGDHMIWYFQEAVLYNKKKQNNTYSKLPFLAYYKMKGKIGQSLHICIFVQKTKHKIIELFFFSSGRRLCNGKNGVLDRFERRWRKSDISVSTHFSITRHAHTNRHVWIPIHLYIIYRICGDLMHMC